MCHETRCFLLNRLRYITFFRDHPFDETTRVKNHPKRKNTQISMSDEPSRGTESLRSAFYKTRENKIPSHLRDGYTLPSKLSDFMEGALPS